MEKSEIENIVIEFTEKRMESSIATFNNLFLAHKQEMKEIVEKQIKETVNGKIDKIANHLERQDKILNSVSEKLDELKPVNSGMKVIKGLREFIIWATPLGILGAMYKWILK